MSVAGRHDRGMSGLFDEMSSDTGVLSHSELKDALVSQDLGVTLTTAQIDGLIDWIDVDNDGQIDKQEILAAEDVYLHSVGKGAKAGSNSIVSASVGGASAASELEQLLNEKMEQLAQSNTEKENFERELRKAKSKLNKVVERWKKLQAQNASLKKKLHGGMREEEVQ